MRGPRSPRWWLDDRHQVGRLPAIEALLLLFDGALGLHDQASAAILLAVPRNEDRIVALAVQVKLALKVANLLLQQAAIDLERKVAAAVALALEEAAHIVATRHAVAVLGDAASALADLVRRAAKLAGAEVGGLVAGRLRRNLRLRGRLDHRHRLDLVKLVGEEPDAVGALKADGDLQDRGVLRADLMKLVRHVPEAQAVGLKRGVVEALPQSVVGAAQALARILGGCLGREAAIFAKLEGSLNVVGVSLGGHLYLP